MNTRDHVFAAITRVIAVCLLPVAYLLAPGHARYFACQWALALRFPQEDLNGLTWPTRTAFTAARSEAFWRDKQLIGLTSGHRDAAEQYRLFNDDFHRPGLPRALPPEQSAHVMGIAMDVRPTEGARWLEHNGARYDLYRTYDNEWWHFEYRPEGRPRRLPYPGVFSSQDWGSMSTIQLMPNLSTQAPNSSPHICFSKGTLTVPPSDSFSQ
jgi:hypothetical protein